MKKLLLLPMLFLISCSSDEPISDTTAPVNFNGSSFEVEIYYAKYFLDNTNDNISNVVFKDESNINISYNSNTKMLSLESIPADIIETNKLIYLNYYGNNSKIYYFDKTKITSIINSKLKADSDTFIFEQKEYYFK